MMKLFFIVLFTVFSSVVCGQCEFDSVSIKFYTALDIHDNVGYRSIDSTMHFDKPNKEWLDVFEDGNIVLRDLSTASWQKDHIVFHYSAGTIQKVVRQQPGRSYTMWEFEYSGDELIRMKQGWMLGPLNDYQVKTEEKGYLLEWTHDETKQAMWSRIDTTLLDICGDVNYGLINFLDFKLKPNNTSASYGDHESDLVLWPNTSSANITCEKDACGNTTVYAKQNKMNGYVLEMYVLEYKYKK